MGAYEIANIFKTFFKVVVHDPVVEIESIDMFQFALSVFHSFVDYLLWLGAPASQSLSQYFQRWDIDE